MSTFLDRELSFLALLVMLSGVAILPQRIEQDVERQAQSLPTRRTILDILSGVFHILYDHAYFHHFTAIFRFFLFNTPSDTDNHARGAWVTRTQMIRSLRVMLMMVVLGREEEGASREGAVMDPDRLQQLLMDPVPKKGKRVPEVCKAALPVRAVQSLRNRRTNVSLLQPRRTPSYDKSPAASDLYHSQPRGEY
ncbi:uncharacterized protein BT62DRAFT_915439 [Guyanagaster necrorhizus]|uniref:Uncharacterized protein n=1 Tax=Guyanagaster necrorhizus TaxID=856835 RepID=A0A9P8AYQ6_9AGAR|nr:uncharacterized protein BT62DRAFT_915439 [Guyanagaster necrorhizus MCA 3950]KAG7453139.1 hypothetical protein BT62DRAFT_915439 [Guyanagaster necrorhizus MCA 3950]